MTSFDLLAAVLPPEGRYCAFGSGRYISQKFFDDRESFDKQIEWLVENKFDAYFGCAKYGDQDNRTHQNASFFRALWMDIDCGEEKAQPNKDGKITGYVDQATGLQAVIGFVKQHKLPRPIVVDSGYGLHFYWILSATIPRNMWVALSHRLRDLAVESGLVVDTSVFEPSRVLRIPGTYNFKNGLKCDVSVLDKQYDTTDYDTWKALISAPEPEEDREFIPRRLSPLMESMFENRVKRFKTIMIKSASGEGCNQLLYCYQHQDEISYNLWRSALSIATHCVDREAAIHKISERHPNYTQGETEAKAEDIGGPHFCTTFERENPNGCDGCQHKGKFKSPIMLGTEIADAEDFDDGDGAEEDAPARPLSPIPEPYFRSKNGAIYFRVPGGEEEPQLVYENNIYVVKRMRDPLMGEVALIKLHLPQDGVSEFTVPLSALVVKEKLREELAKHGVAAGNKQMDMLINYLILSVKNLQVTHKAEIMRTQFGWTDNDTKVIIGDREVTIEGTFYSPPSSATKTIVDSMTPVGSLEKWKEVFNLYKAKGLEPHAFAALSGFGSLLLRFTGISGAMINLIHSRSGSGKSTILYVANSIFGHPRELASIWKDTFNSKMHRLGVMNNVLNTIDEITNTTPQEFSDLVYSISQGRGKNRMKASTNEERINLTSWQSMTLCSANASFYEKLGALKDSPDGESMRLLEYRIEPTDIIPMELGKQMFDHQLLENYGHAGEIYAEWLVKNLDEVKKTLRAVQAKIDKEVNFSSRERFWSAVAACNITGGLIAKSLGLHDYDMKAIYDWLINMLKEMRGEITPPLPAITSTIGDFLNSHIQNTLVVNGMADARTNLDALPSMEPKGELLVRYEPDTHRMYIAVSAFRKYCVERQINYKDLIQQLTAKSIMVGTINKRLSKGMKVISPAVRVLELDADKGEFYGFVEAGNGDRDSQVQG